RRTGMAKLISKYFKLSIIIGTLLIFEKEIKYLIKGSVNMDIIDIMVDIAIYIGFVIIAVILRKNYIINQISSDRTVKK
ncbi:MAG: hypothetical protein Q8920_13830, partial [Bacillota bacterium]|nr:hypothetical protein [Bacillota bacterium]